MPRIVRQLVDGEPVVELNVQPETAFRDAVLADGTWPPLPLVHARAVIDTGAQRTMIYRPLIEALRIAPTGYTTVFSVSGDSPREVCDTYRVGLTLLDQTAPFEIGDCEVIAGRFAGLSVQALIGCDVLSRCDFHYSGRSGTFTLEF